jgi:hypothetical protein
MIKLYDQIPHVYMDASRDFQYLARLFDVVLNSVKHNIDGMYSLPYCPENIDITELLAFTLGFKVKRNYDKDQLSAIASIIPTLLKYKGTQTAVDLLGHALIKASGARGNYQSYVKEHTLEVILPKERVDVNLFLDILPYILPAGLRCNITRRTIHQNSLNTEAGYETAIKALLVKDYEINRLYKIPAQNADFHNILGSSSNQRDNDPYRPNIGLMDNNIIPVYSNSDLNTILGITSAGSKSSETDTDKE